MQGSLAGFVARQAWLLKPRRVILSHHDDWLPGFSTATDNAPSGSSLPAVVATATELAEIGYLDDYRVFDGLVRPG